MAYLGRSYRTYAMDFWGFGESGKKRDTYAVQDFVSLVDQFMDRLGITEAPLIGHSMGGTVSLSVAIQYPQRVSKVVVVGSPIVGSSLAFPLKLAGYRFIAFMLFNMMWAFRAGIKVASPFICADPQFPTMMDKDLSSTTLESFLRSIASLRRTDLRPKLSQLQIPIMGIYGGRDNIVHPMQWQPLLQGAPQTKVVYWERAQHFVMLDMAKEFTETVRIFLDEEEQSEG